MGPHINPLLLSNLYSVLAGGSVLALWSSEYLIAAAAVCVRC